MVGINTTGESWGTLDLWPLSPAASWNPQIIHVGDGVVGVAAPYRDPLALVGA